MDIAGNPIHLRAFNSAVANIPELGSRLLAHGIGCHGAVEAALLDVCKSVGMSECAFLETKAARAQKIFTIAHSGQDPILDAVVEYDSERHFGAAVEKLRSAFEFQLALDCGRFVCSQPYSRDGIVNAIKTVADNLGVQTGKRAFGNYKPVLVTPLTSDLSLVAILCWHGLSPTSPDAGLDWQFCIFDGGVEKARIAKVLNPPAVYRLDGLKMALPGIGFMLRHKNIHEVHVFTASICILMLWLSENYAHAN